MCPEEGNLPEILGYKRSIFDYPDRQLTRGKWWDLATTDFGSVRIARLMQTIDVDVRRSLYCATLHGIISSTLDNFDAIYMYTVDNEIS